MRGWADVLKIWLYAGAVVLLGAWLAPFVHNAGKAVDEVGSVKQTNALFHWLAGVCGRADFQDFFAASLVMVALLLAIPFVDWVRGGRFSTQRKLRGILVPKDDPDVGGLAKRPRGWREAASGFAILGGACLLAAMAGLAGGWQALAIPPPGFALTLLVPLGWAAAGGIVLEILFRGGVLGLFLRAMPPVPAVVLTALLSAAVPLLHPLARVAAIDPDAPGAGFVLLAAIVRHAATPAGVIAAFAPAFGLGLLLGAARLRTASLFLPAGLHAGWLFATHLATTLTLADAGMSRGFASLAALRVAAFAVFRHTRRHDGETGSG